MSDTDSLIISVNEATAEKKLEMLLWRDPFLISPIPELGRESRAILLQFNPK